MKVGVLVIATGKYENFFEQLYDSFEENFLPGHQKVYFYLTDSKQTDLPYNVEKYKINHEEWPGPTLHRYRNFLSIEKEIIQSGVDCLYYTDVDMKAISKMGDEILPTKQKPIIAVAHPGFYKLNLGTPETRKISKAYIDPKEKRDYYVAGGFQGGMTHQYLTACDTINKMINTDEANGIIPVWHDESMWNRYYTSNIDKYKILSPSYCYPEAKYLQGEKLNNYKTCENLKPKLLALDKNHKWYRSE